MSRFDRTVATLTARTLIGRRRAAVLVVLPLVLLVLALVVRLVGGRDDASTVSLLGTLGLGTLLPLLGVTVGTGAIGPEIDDGSIVYLLAKPLRRSTIVLSKLAVAVLLTLALGALPVLLAGLVLSGPAHGLAVGYAVGCAVAGTAYCAVFLLLAVVTRNAVLVGLGYALVWETTVAGLVPGARALSIRQWSLTLTERIVDVPGVTSAVDLLPGVLLLVAVTAGATWAATQRLRGLQLTGNE